MAEANWSSYVGMAAGIIGAITGIAGAIMGYISYRRSNKIKSLDLRLEFRKAISDVHNDLNRLKELIDNANRSRQAVLAARGMSRSGPMEKFKNEIASDKAKTRELFKRAPKAEVSYDKLQIKELESELVAVHKLKGEIKGLLDKYSEVIRSDNAQRKQLSEDQLARHIPRT